MKCDVYDEGVVLEVVRNGNTAMVAFKELTEGDVVIQDGYHIVVEVDAHQCDDVCYAGWVMYGNGGNSYFPEDFGAALLKGGG